MNDTLVDFPEGFTEGLSMDHYHADNAYSKSDFVNAERSTRHVIDMRIHKKAPTASMLIGSAAHLMILEPEKVEKELHVTDCATRRGKKWEEEKAEQAGKLIITRKEMDTIEPMVESVMEHPVAAPLLKNGLAEVSCKTTLKLDGEGVDTRVKLPVKCRPDYLPKQPNIVVDLKTAKDVTPEGFGRDAYAFRYHWSAFLTCLILEALTGKQFEYHFVVVENKYPFETVVYKANDFDLQVADVELTPIMMNLALAKQENTFFPIAKFEVMDLQLPPWANKNAMIPDF